MSTVAKKIIMGSGAVDVPSDDDFNTVGFLSHFDGANNGVNNVFDDESDNNHTVTPSSGVTQGSFSPFSRPDGEWGAYFDGTGDGLSAPASNDFDLGTGDWTVEFFINAPDQSDKFIVSFRSASNDLHITTGGYQSTSGVLRVSFGGSSHVSSTVVCNNTWKHCAITRSSNTVRMYVNGSLETTATNNTDMSAGAMAFATNGIGGGNNLTGNLSNFRMLKGTALYTGSSFTVPASSLTAITNTVVLTLQSNRFIDNSASAHVMTAAGDTKVTPFSPLSTEVYDPETQGGGTELVNAQNTYLSFPLNGDFVFSGDFCVETWFYGSGGDRSLYVAYDGSTYFALNVSVSAAQFNIYLGVAPSGNVWTVSNTVKANAWHHIALTRSGSTLNIFQDGVSLGTNTSSATFGYSSPQVNRIGGGASGTASKHGSFRIVKGSPVYTSNFTPPTARLTAITNTEILLNMANAQAFDSAAQNNLTLAGNAKISTSQSKFGGRSLSLDGGTSYCYARYPNEGNIGSSPFTIEFWIYGTFNNGTVKIIFDGRSAGDTSQWMLAQEADNTWAVQDSDGNEVASGWDANTFSNNTWTHVAISRSGSTTKYFINGTATASVSDSTNWVNGDLTIGGRYADAGNSHLGYIDEFRISKIARYTSNFTPDTEPFPDRGEL